MKRFAVAGLASLLLHAGGGLALWKIISAPPDGLRALLVELGSPLAERLPPLRVPVQKTRSRPDVLQPAPPSDAIPALPSLDETLIASRAGAGAASISPTDEPAKATPPNATLPAHAPVDAGSIGVSLEPVPPPSGPQGKAQGTPVSGPGAPSSSGPAFPAAFPAQGDAPNWGFLTLLRSRIEGSLIYPPTARRRGLAGLVELEIRLNFDGSVAKITVVRSSGHALLDQAAVRGVEEAAPFSLPPDLPHRPVTVLVPIAFELR